MAVAGASLALSTLVIALLREAIHVTYPAPVYLLAVLIVGARYGTLPATATSIAAFLLYDFLFVQPLYALTINNPDEWLNLLVLLAVSAVIGRMAALQSARAAEAADRARQAEGLHSVTGVLAATRTVAEAAPTVVKRLCEATSMDRVWVALGPSPAEERTLADTESGKPIPRAGFQTVLQRSPDGRMRWARAHMPGTPAWPRATLHRIRVEVAGDVIGSLWALRQPGKPEPDRAETRILSAAADQLGQAIVRDRLAVEATTAEIARQSEALKTALLDSVSHDLRTPLATIRAAAGSMLDPQIQWSESDKREAFEAIDQEAERMGRLVRNLLDLSRIEGGALRPELEARDLTDFARQSIARLASGGKSVSIRSDADMPIALVDEVYLSQILTNLLENAVRYGGDRIEVGVRETDGRLALTVEDNGAGVPAAALPRLFDKFYQVPRSERAGRRGMGIGLTVVAGLARAMGGTVAASRSRLGGLAVSVTLPAAEVPAESETETGVS
jgi:two-component system sensor histidine kinase KdpD